MHVAVVMEDNEIHSEDASVTLAKRTIRENLSKLELQKVSDAINIREKKAGRGNWRKRELLLDIKK